MSAFLGHKRRPFVRKAFSQITHHKVWSAVRKCATNTIEAGLIREISYYANVGSMLVQKPLLWGGQYINLPRQYRPISCDYIQQTIT